MSHDTPWRQALPSVREPVEQIKSLLVSGSRLPVDPSKKRGRPVLLSQTQLALGVLWCFVENWHAQLDVWRLILCGFGPFAPLHLSDQAVYKRLAQQGTEAMSRLFEQVSAWLREWLHPCQDWSLAPFAREVYALDESILDQVARWLQAFRSLPLKDPGLLPGRLACWFDVRRQQWVRIDVLKDGAANCKVHARAMLAGIAPQSLLLFDRGYYAFEWFDELTHGGYFWISRLVNKGSYTLQHVFVEADGYLEALVYLGAFRSDRAACMVRLVCFRYQGKWYRYITNVLDPRQLSGADIAGLYARRWDIELAFRALKDYLGLNVLWSAKWEVIGVQIWACAILAQIFHALQVKLADEAGVDPFDVSLHLVLRLVPRLRSQGLDPFATLLELGREMRVIRPNSRHRIQAPDIPWHGFAWPPGDLVYERTPRYAHKAAGNVNRKKKAT